MGRRGRALCKAEERVCASLVASNCHRAREVCANYSHIRSPSHLASTTCVGGCLDPQFPATRSRCGAGIVCFPGISRVPKAVSECSMTARILRTFECAWNEYTWVHTACTLGGRSPEILIGSSGPSVLTRGGRAPFVQIVGKGVRILSRVCRFDRIVWHGSVIFEIKTRIFCQLPTSFFLFVHTSHHLSGSRTC